MFFQITYDEFLLYMQSKGVEYQSILTGGNTSRTDNFFSFSKVTFSTAIKLTRKIYFKVTYCQMTRQMSDGSTGLCCCFVTQEMYNSRVDVKIERDIARINMVEDSLVVICIQERRHAKNCGDLH